MRSILPLAVSGAVILLGACEQAEPTSPLDVPKPLFNFENAPDNTAIVVRYDNTMQGLSVCADGYCAYHGIDPADAFCAGNWWNDPLWDWQKIDTPSDMQIAVALAQNVHTYVWPRYASCDEMLAHEPVGEGFSNFRETHTTRAGVTVTWRWKAQGALTSPTGDPVSYNMLLRYTRDNTGDWHSNAFIKAWVYSPGSNHWYALTDSYLPWPEAEQQAQGLGGHLLTLNSAEEEQWVMDNFAPGSWPLWIGFSDVAEEGNWVWVSGEPVTYTNWGPGAPDGYLDESFAAMNAPPVHEWNDFSLSTWWIGIVERTSAP